MTTSNEDTLDPVTDHEPIGEVPDTLDPVPDRVPEKKPTRKRKPSMKRKVTDGRSQA